jgi:hypothetical protein
MKCPHCLVEFHPKAEEKDIGDDVNGLWKIAKYECPNPICKQIILFLINHEGEIDMISNSLVLTGEIKTTLIHPKGLSRIPLPSEVPREFVGDYKEACLVLSDSPKASAALSRRCLQNLLREVAKVKHVNLSDEIQQVIDSKTLPSHLSESIDAIRNIGNFAAHPIKSEKAGEIIDVEPGEAEWSLDVLEILFDFYFVQPAKLKAKREALNKKLKEASKPKMK